MNAVIYARFSCSKQREESIEGQIRECTAYAQRNGIEIVGTYNPLMNPSEFKVDAEKVQKWIKNGAQPTDTVRALLKKSNII